MALESVFISALLLTHLTKPSEFLKTFGLHSICQVFWRSSFCFRHFGLCFRIIQLHNRTGEQSVSNTVPLKISPVMSFFRANESAAKRSKLEASSSREDCTFCITIGTFPQKVTQKFHNLKIYETFRLSFHEL